MNLLLLGVCVLLPNIGLAFGEAPPTLPPQELVHNLTLAGQVPLEYYYVDDSNAGKGTHYKYSSKDITELIAEAEQFIAEVLSFPLPPPPHAITHSTWVSQLTDIWLVHALQTHTVTGKRVVIFGSTSPWYESIVLALGASYVTVVEYNRLTYDHPAITTLLLRDLPQERQFDIAISLSSFDHDGLGRYGDPINPEGDLQAMKTVASVLRDGGILFLTVPIGPDLVVWNLHRRYGNLRLPLLLRGWDELECVGWDERLVTAEAPYTIAYEPVFVLRSSV